MKEQWRNDKKVATLEEGLQEEKQEYINNLKYKSNCCKQWIRYIKLIFLLELMLFFGWGCYMILQSYHFRVTENEVTDITRERYSTMLKSISEAQKSNPITEMSAKFVKPEIIVDKLNNFLRRIKLIKEQNKTIVIDANRAMQTSTQNSINILSNDMMEPSDINNSPMTSPSEDLISDERFTKNLMPCKSSPIKYIDKIISTNDNKDFINKQFYEKLQDIAKPIAINNLERKQFKSRYDSIEDVNRLTSNNQKDESNKIENLGLDVTTTSNLRDYADFDIKFKNSVQDSKEKFSDLIQDAVQNDYSEKSSSRDGTDEQINTSLGSDPVICPSQSYETLDMSSEYSIKSSRISQTVSKLLEQIKNVLSDIVNDTENKVKHDTNDRDMSMLDASSDASASGSKHTAFNTWIPIALNTQDYHSSEMIANIKQEDDKLKLMNNIESSLNVPSLLPKRQNVESSTSNVVEFEWFNAPPLLADDLQFGSIDTSKSSKIQSQSLEDTIENMDTIDGFISEKDKLHIQCLSEININVFRIKCPEILFNEKWNLPSSSDTDTSDTVDLMNDFNFKDNFDIYDYDYDIYDDEDESEQSKDKLMSNENSDEKVASSQHSVIDEVALQRNTSDVRSWKDKLDFIFKINFFNKTEVDEHEVINSSNEKEIKQAMSSPSTIFSFTNESDSDTIVSNEKQNSLQEVTDMQQQKQLKVTKGQDSLNSENTETLWKNNEHVYALEKAITSIFNNEMLNIIKLKYASKNFSENNQTSYICSTLPYVCFPFSNSWRQQYVDLKKILGYILNHDNSYDVGDNYNYRKKRMADDLTEQREQVSNTLEEADKNVDLLKQLKKLFQKMEILAAGIDRLHERLNNIMDDDYILNKFSLEIKEL